MDSRVKKGRPKGSRNLVEGNRIDKEVFENACLMYATQDELAFLFHTSPVSLNNWCQKVYGCSLGEFTDRAKGITRFKVRSKMINQALSGNTLMLLFLSKQKEFLGYTDRPVENQFDEKIVISSDIPMIESEDNGQSSD